MSPFEERVSDLSEKLMEWAGEHAKMDGQLNSLLFALAAAEVLGSNFSLLPSGSAAQAMEMTVDRMVEFYQVGAANGGPIQ